MRHKPKKCRERAPGCQEEYVPFSSFQSTCQNPACALKKAQRDREKAERKKRARTRQEDKAARERLKPRRKWLQESQAEFNKFIRIRDQHKPCICCGEPLADQKFGGGYDCGHYRSVGSAPHLRFNVFNAAAQRKKCNSFESGRAVDYRLGLIARIGLERVERLEANNERKTFDIEYLKRIKKIFRRRARLLKKRRER